MSDESRAANLANRIGGPGSPGPRYPDNRPTAEFTNARPLAAEGARVGIVTCLRCGAAVLLDPADTIDPVERHRWWHMETGI